MGLTFEELAGEGLDTLFQGALFLSGGRDREAERLLVDCLTLAYRESRNEVVPTVVRWLEERLVRSFLARESGAEDDAERQATPTAFDASTLQDIGPAAMFAAAGVLPPWPRAALWLVLVQRWPYCEAADALEVSPDHLRELLRYRDVLLTTLLRPPKQSRVTGTDPRAR